VERFSQASSAEGSTENSILLRIVHPIIGTFEESIGRSNWLGVGVGYGANAVSTLLTGTQVFTTGEDEFSRVINEFGAPAGIAFMLFRGLLAVMILSKALARVREHQPLPWLLVPLMFWTLVFGVLEQPTEQGFMVMSVAFSLAALRLAPTPIESGRPWTSHGGKARLACVHDEARGHRRLSLRCYGSGNKGSTKAHNASVIGPHSFLPVQEAHLPSCLMRKNPLEVEPNL
jgi:hypothetical protein